MILYYYEERFFLRLLRAPPTLPANISPPKSNEGISINSKAGTLSCSKINQLCYQSCY